MAKRHAPLTEIINEDINAVPVRIVGGAIGTGGLTDAELRASPLPVSSTDLDIRDLTHVSDSVKIGDGTNTATIRDLAANDALNVAIVDGAGNQITSFGGTGGTQYTEGDIDASITGTAMMMEGAANTLVAAPGTAVDGLLVNLGANNDVTVAGVATAANQLPDGHNVTVDNAAGAAAVNIQDGGNSITVDATSLPLPTGAATSALQLPNSHDVTVDNAAGASAVNIQDGGNSITVDGALTADTELTVKDFDTGAGTDNVAVVGLVVPASGGSQTVGHVISVAAGASPGGFVLLGRRKDSLATWGTADGAYTAPQFDANGRLYATATVDNASGASAVNIQDGGNSITVDATSLPLPTGAATSALQLPNSHDVTIDNAAGAAAVNVQDGGNALTVDAVNLDIRDLTHASDSVQIGDGSNTATVRNLAANDALNVAIVDGAGNQITSFGGTGGTQYTEGDTDASITGTAMMMEGAGDALVAAPGTAADGLLVNLGANNDVTVAGVSTAANQLPDGHNVTVDNAAGAAAVNIQDGGNSITVDGTVGVSGSVAVTGPLTDAQLRATAVPVSAASLPLPAGAATSALQLPNSHDVTVDNAAGVAAVNIQDGGNSITVDGTVAVSGSVAVTGPLTDAQLRATPVPVSGTVTIGVFPDNEPFNVAQINGVAPLMGAGISGTGSLRTVTADNSPEVVSVQIMDDWDESDRAKVNIIAGQAGITAGAGAVAANTPRVTHASDDPVTTSVQLLDDTVFTDDAAFTPATSKVLAIGAVCDDTSPDSVNEGDIGAPRMKANRILYSQLRDATNERDITTDLDSDSDVGADADCGLHTSHIPKIYTESLSTLNQEYTSGDTYPVSSHSGANGIDCRRFTRGMLFFTLDSTGTPTDILIQLMFSPDSGTTWFPKADAFWANLYFDDTICATAINRCYSFDCDGDDLLRVYITATGTGAAGATSFTISNCFVTLKCR